MKNALKILSIVIVSTLVSCGNIAFAGNYHSVFGFDRPNHGIVEIQKTYSWMKCERRAHLNTRFAHPRYDVTFKKDGTATCPRMASEHPQIIEVAPEDPQIKPDKPDTPYVWTGEEDEPAKVQDWIRWREAKGNFSTTHQDMIDHVELYGGHW